MRIFSALAGLSLACVLVAAPFDQAAASCGPEALGTSRTIEIDPNKNRSYKGKEEALGLRHKEVILTFDDGPIAGKTSRILKALKKECVKATFFYVGRMAKAYTKLVRRVVADGHTLAHHTQAHNALPKYSTAKASSLIDQGVRRLQKIAYGVNSSKPRTPFFRYPYLARNKRTDRLLARKGLIAFGANIDALDWKKWSPSKVHNRIMRLVRREGKGIILMHDIQNRTAKMLPRLLRSLKAEGYKVVHMVPKGTPVVKDDPIVVAEVAKPSLSDVSVPSKPDAVALDVMEDVVAIAEAEVSSSKLQEKKVVDRRTPAPKNVTSKINTAALDQNTSRTGIVVSKPSPAAKTQEAVAKAFNAQLKMVRKKTSRKSRQIVKLKNKRTTKRKLRKKSYMVLAGNRRTKVVKAGGWKLRRSQWILR